MTFRELPWSVTLLKLQCAAWQDESLTINRRRSGRRRSRCTWHTIQDFILESAGKLKRRPARIAVVRPGLKPDISKTQLHSVAATSSHSATVQLSQHFPSYLGHWREDVRPSVPMLKTRNFLLSAQFICSCWLLINRHSTVSSCHFQTKKRLVGRRESSDSSSTHSTLL